MNEYNEALSRLNAFERPPNVRYIKHIPFGDYPDHTSKHEYNRILAESRFSKLPKYSIPQRFYINEDDAGQAQYFFDFDKTFVNANGDRKSVAVRRIYFEDITVETEKIKQLDANDIAVCSTINPYSIQNIIGSAWEQHDMLNKLYPYDRQINFILWFNDKNGNRIVGHKITGYLDLELIIDNHNNLNLDV